MLIDIHVHSTISRCSRMTPEEILIHARDMGLDGVCITDHDTTAILSQIEEGFQSDGLLVLVGMEYTTPQGDFLVHGAVEELSPGMTALELFVAVAGFGGAVVAAHPYRGWRPSDISVISPSDCSIVEVENGRNSDHENTLAMSLAKKHKLTAVSGSDAHALDELGVVPTRFTVPIACRSDLVQALKQGHCEPTFVSRGIARTL